jgi:hypothetical protein
MWHVGGGEKPTEGFGGENLMKTGHLIYIGLDGSIILKLIFKKWNRRIRHGII